MKIFVISLKNSIERRQYISNLLSGIGLSFTFFDAENIRENIHHDIFRLYDKRKTLSLKGYELTIPELGCFASHIALWKKCIQINEPILILEDNINLLGDISCQLINIANLTNTHGLIKLSNIFPREYIFVDSIDNNYNLVSYKSGACGTSAYAISPFAAKKYLDMVDGFFEPVDDFMDNEWRTKQTLFNYYPSLICRSEIKSTIGLRKVKNTINPIIKTKSEIYRNYKKIRQCIYNRTKK